MSKLTQLYWSSNYDPRVIFYTYPDLTSIQESLLNILFNCVNDFKGKSSDGNVFPTIP